MNRAPSRRDCRVYSPNFYWMASHSEFYLWSLLNIPLGHHPFQTAPSPEPCSRLNPRRLPERKPIARRATRSGLRGGRTQDTKEQQQLEPNKQPRVAGRDSKEEIIKCNAVALTFFVQLFTDVRDRHNTVFKRRDGPRRAGALYEGTPRGVDDTHTAAPPFPHPPAPSGRPVPASKTTEKKDTTWLGPFSSVSDPDTARS